MGNESDLPRGEKTSFDIVVRWSDWDRQAYFAHMDMQELGRQLTRLSDFHGSFAAVSLSMDYVEIMLAMSKMVKEAVEQVEVMLLFLARPENESKEQLYMFQQAFLRAQNPEELPRRIKHLHMLKLIIAELHPSHADIEIITNLINLAERTHLIHKSFASLVLTAGKSNKSPVFPLLFSSSPHHADSQEEMVKSEHKHRK